jgi:hypothetical protein
VTGNRALRAGIAGLSLALSACGDGGAGEPPPGSTFIAFAASFAGFRAWESFPLTSSAAVGSVHVSGPRTEYLNHAPPRGSHAFPIGTIIVKESEVGDLPDRKVFAMVKRGGDYNANGARDWEWFELKNVDDQEVTIIWHGVGPPAGEMYGGDPRAGCNSCHVGSASNDFVQSAALSLDNF